MKPLLPKEIEYIQTDTSDASTTINYETICEKFANQYGLSPREREVLALLGRGHTSKYIAEQLFISDNTARNHMKNIYRKTNVGSKDELFAKLSETEKKLQKNNGAGQTALKNQ